MKSRARVPGERCPVRTAVATLGGRWKPLIVYYLQCGTRRFSELQRLIPEVSRQVLAQQLRQLEQDGVVIRTVYPVVPPKVEYTLSDLGRELDDIMTLLERWGERVLARQDASATLASELSEQG
jgi:DNA-binding HxlR family transcriptional regulator